MRLKLTSVLTTEVQLRAGAQGVDYVDHQAVGGSPKRQWPGGDQQGHHVEEVRQVGGHVQGVVEGKHEHVARQDGDVVPHEVLLQCGRRRQASFVYDLAHSTNHLPRRIKQSLSLRLTVSPWTYLFVA